MEYVYTSFVFLLSIIEAVLFYHVVCRRKLAVVTWSSLIPLLVLYFFMILCVMFTAGRFYKTVIIMILYYLAGTIFTRTGWIENIKYWILSFLLSAAVEQIMYQVVWGNIFESVSGYGAGNVLICASVSIVLLIINKLSGSKNAGEIQYSEKIFWILTPAACAIISGVSYMAYVVDKLDNTKEKQFTLFILLFSIVGVCIIIIMILYILWQRENFRIKADMENKYNQQQRAYFMLMLEKEEGTRRFRHDILNHFICLQGYIENKQYHAAEAYLKNLLAEMNAIRERQYETGNEVVNILLNYYLIPVKEKCTVIIDGYLGRLDHISQMDICTIFSNVLKNAVEAVEENGSIKIDIVRKEKFAEIVIGNSFTQEVHVSEKGRLQTAKEDKDNHGFGLENVKRVIQNNHGEFEYHVNGNWFEVEIIIPV